MTPILAMWSGPRNLSTAMMRAWENRADTQVWDEPLYGHYLQSTGADHPMREDILAHHPADYDTVSRECATAPANGFFYQKHMTHHVLPGDSLDWMRDIHHCFLLRNPREVLISYSKKREKPELEDIGLSQQLRIYEWVTQHCGETPLVVDAGDFLDNPRGYLRAICTHVDLAFDESMLSWPAGPRGSDGVWAAHWYDSVWKSTGFVKWENRDEQMDPELEPVLKQAEPIYRQLFEKRLVIKAANETHP